MPTISFLAYGFASTLKLKELVALFPAGSARVEKDRLLADLGPMRWALAVAALLIAVAIPFYRSAMNEQHQQELAKADAALLEQIDAEVSRAVPPPMEPLIELVAWDSTNTRGGVKRR